MDACLFCKLVQGEIPAKTVYEDDQVMAFHDINPQAPTHVLVIPKAHVASMAEVTDPMLAGIVMVKAAEIARQLGVEEGGYRLVANTGAGAGQTVFHLHVHILAGRPLHWPPG